MKIKAILVLALLAAVLVVGCTRNDPTGNYAAYNQPQQGQYVGGGCGVAPSGDVADTPVSEITESAYSA